MSLCLGASGSAPSAVTRKLAARHGCSMFKPVQPCSFRGLPRLSRRSLISQSTGKEETQVETTVVVPEVVEDDIVSPFFEPLVRAFALGIGAGVIVEVSHVLFKFVNFAAYAGASLPSLLPEVLGELSPLLVVDNAAAMFSSLVFYVIEAAAVLAVLRQYPDDTRTATNAIMNTVTLGKRLMPVKLVNLKRFMYTLLSARKSPSAAISMLGFLPDSAGAPNLPGPAPSSYGRLGGSSTSVLERPSVAVPTLDIPTALPMPEPTLPEVAPTPSDTKSQALRAPEAKVVKPKPLLPKTGREGLRPGEMKPDTLPLSKRAKELRDRRSYLKNFWYAAAISEKLKEEPIEVQILGRTVVLFRDETGKPRCLDNVCPHRGAPLGKGWVKQVEGHNCVVCPYHGWAFDAQGKLTEVPSSADRDHLPKRSLVDAYPVEEKGGFVWLFFGSSSMPKEERPPIPAEFVTELEDPNWRPVYGEIEFECGHWGVFENAIDMAHIHYLHGDSFGNKGKPVIHDMQVKRDTFHIEGTFRIHNKPVSPLWEFTATESVPVTAKAFLPSTSSIQIQLGAGVSMITFVNTVPISATRAVNRFCLIRNFAGWDGFDLWARRAMFKILGEDKVMVEKLQPEAIRAEVSLEADLPQIAFRKLRQEWIDMGYGVEPEVTTSHDGTLDL